jgi:uncharacterized protein YycO
MLGFLRVLCLLLVAAPATAATSLQEGDIIFHTSRSSQSLAIQHATKSPYSHMGVVLSRNGEFVVYEASATVRYTPLKAWIARGDGGRYVVKRLKGGLTTAQKRNLTDSANAFDGKAYDLTFEWSDGRIYCSELVWKMYKRALGIEIGPTQKLKDFDLTSKAVKAKMKERYGSKVPMNETVISPAAMFEAKNLETVHAGA